MNMVQKEHYFEDLDLSSFPKGLSTGWITIVSNSFGNDINVPIMIFKGKQSGPTLCLTAVLHGDELNGLSVIQKVFKKVTANNLRGTLVGIPVANVPGFLRKERLFTDGRDLNHCFPGSNKGAQSQVYAYNFFEKIIKKCDYLIDLHTARVDNLNTFHARADLSNTKIRNIAQLLNAQIILDSTGGEGTLRYQATLNNIPAITCELGNPSKFQGKLISEAILGITNCMIHLGMLQGDYKPTQELVICKGSQRINTTQGGVLTVLPKLGQVVQKGEKIAIVKDIFGTIIEEYFAPRNGIVIGKNNSPVNPEGSRILHLGHIKN